MAYDKRVIVDFDDTIATTTTRDWDNAVPHWDVINRINNLYEKGWEVWIVTARGQLSCNGDFEAADRKYRKIMEEWLKTHGVKYHLLSFEKRLASYYIDDKALMPEEFVDLEIREIKTGWSGAKVEKRGDRIFKTHPDSLMAAKWYNMAAPLVNVPIVHSMIGQTLSLEYLEDNGAFFKMDDINDAIDKFRLYKTGENYRRYIVRMRDHCRVNDDFYDIIDILKSGEFYAYCSGQNSFMHGDLSLENVIQTDKGLYFIDPIYNERQWSSYLLDISKMLHSYRKYNRMFEYEVFLNTWVERLNMNYGDYNKDDIKYILQVLEVSQWIRVIKYIPDLIVKKDMHEKTKQLLNEIIKYKKEKWNDQKFTN
jgi:capsule biosynthesis phosphatase